MEIPYLFLCDYDQTLFDTKARSPRGIGLAEGYEHAVLQIFGPKGLECYRTEGGLQNRAPSEVVSSLAKNVSLLGFACNKHCGLYLKGHKLSVDMLEGSIVSKLAELLVYFKLQLFMVEISLSWPKPYAGVREFFKTISLLKKKDKLPIQSGILSSGHTSFIRKTLDLRGMPYPDLLVTDDDLRPLKHPSNPHDRVKPSPFPFEFLKERWLSQIRSNKLMNEYRAKDVMSRVAYIGDDPAKDGGLAQNVGVPFGWFRVSGESNKLISADSFPKGSFTFSKWAALNYFLQSDPVKDMFRCGAPLPEILAQF